MSLVCCLMLFQWLSVVFSVAVHHQINLCEPFVYLYLRIYIYIMYICMYVCLPILAMCRAHHLSCHRCQITSLTGHLYHLHLFCLVQHLSLSLSFSLARVNDGKSLVEKSLVIIVMYEYWFIAMVVLFITYDCFICFSTHLILLLPRSIQHINTLIRCTPSSKVHCTLVLNYWNWFSIWTTHWSLIQLVMKSHSLYNATWLQLLGDLHYYDQ